MKIISFLFLALFAVSAEALKGQGGRQLQQCDDGQPSSPQEGDCEICSKCNKENKPTSIRMRYNPAGMNSRYQGESFATCRAGTYPSVTSISAAGSTYQVSAGTEFTLTADGDKFDAETDFTFGNGQECFIHTSCSAPIVAGDQIGPFEILGKDFCDGGGGEGNCGFEGCVVCDSDNKEFPNGVSRKPSVLTFIYRANGQNSMFQPADKASCRAASYPSQTVIQVEGQSISVVDGQQFTVFSSDGDNFPAELDFVIGGSISCFIHASCSVPIVAGDVIGPFEVVGDNTVCVPCDDPCVRPQKSVYDCAEPISIDFDVTDETDVLGQATGPLPNDWIGIYPCNNVFSDTTFFHSIVFKYVCDEFTGNDSARCQLDPTTYPSGTVTIDMLPSYGNLGPHIWPVTAFVENNQVNDQFKAVLMRADGPSTPPFVPVCESECFTIIPDQNSRVCKTRQSAIELPADSPAAFCFPGDASVQVEGKGLTYMKDLSLGDKVLTQDNQYDTIYSFGHKNADVTTDYVNIATTAASVDISVDHMVYLKGGNVVPAGIIKVGDEVEIIDGTFSPVREIKVVEKEGAFAPFTASGAIVVNGIKASNYVAFQKSANLHIAGIDTGLSFHTIAHVFQIPHRMWCLHLSSSCTTETYDAQGVSTWVSLPNLFFRFVFAQNAAVLAVVAAVTMVVARKTVKKTSA